MRDMKVLLAELFGFHRFVSNKRLEDMINDTLNRYDDNAGLSIDDLESAAGGINNGTPHNNEGGDNK